MHLDLIRRRQLTGATGSENLAPSEAQALGLLDASVVSTRQKLRAKVAAINDALDEMTAELADLLE
jgi:hypothetical protein